MQIIHKLVIVFWLHAIWSVYIMFVVFVCNLVHTYVLTRLYCLCSSKAHWFTLSIIVECMRGCTRWLLCLCHTAPPTAVSGATPHPEPIPFRVHLIIYIPRAGSFTFPSVHSIPPSMMSIVFRTAYQRNNYSPDSSSIENWYVLFSSN